MHGICPSIGIMWSDNIYPEISTQELVAIFRELFPDASLQYGKEGFVIDSDHYVAILAVYYHRMDTVRLN